MKFNSIKFKVGILYIAILGLVLIVYNGFVYFNLRHLLYSDLDAALQRKTQEIADTINSYLEILEEDNQNLENAARRIITLKGESVRRKEVVELELRWNRQFDKLDLSEDYIQFVSVDNKVIVRSRNVDNETGALFLGLSRGSDLPIFTKAKVKKKNLRIIQAPFYLKGSLTHIIQIGTSQKPIISLLERRQNFLVASVPIVMIIAGFLSYLFAVRLLSPVTKITELAENITHEDLSERLEIEYYDEEMLLLTNAFNNMIARLEKSFKHIGEFSSHVAHELKTPIAIMRGEIELALGGNKTPAEYKGVLKSGLEETHRMLKIIDDLLLLSKLDYKPEIFVFERFSLWPFFEKIIEHSRMLASSKNISISSDLKKVRKNIQAYGNVLHLRRLFFNIIHNAVKFTPENGEIDVSVTTESKAVVIRISDSGIGIQEEDLPKIYDLFFTANPSDIGIEVGTGLGLNIALSISKIHNGLIEVESRVGEGTTFTVNLPII